MKKFSLGKQITIILTVAIVSLVTLFALGTRNQNNAPTSVEAKLDYLEENQLKEIQIFEKEGCIKLVYDKNLTKDNTQTVKTDLWYKMEEFEDKYDSNNYHEDGYHSRTLDLKKLSVCGLKDLKLSDISVLKFRTYIVDTASLGQVEVELKPIILQSKKDFKEVDLIKNKQLVNKYFSNVTSTRQDVEKILTEDNNLTKDEENERQRLEIELAELTQTTDKMQSGVNDIKDAKTKKGVYEKIKENRKQIRFLKQKLGK